MCVVCPRLTLTVSMLVASDLFRLRLTLFLFISNVSLCSNAGVMADMFMNDPGLHSRLYEQLP